MQRFRGNTYRNSRAAAAGGARGLSNSLPQGLPSSEPFRLPDYEPPARGANKNQRYSNFKGYQPPRPGSSYFPGGVPSRLPAPSGAAPYAAGAAAGMTRLGWLGILFGGAFFIGYYAGRMYRDHRYGKWRMRMMGYAETLYCVAPVGIIEGSGFASACSSTIGTSLGTKWDGTTRPAALHSRGNPGFLELPGGYQGTRAVKWNRPILANRPASLPAPRYDPWRDPGKDPWSDPGLPNPQVDPLSSPIGQPQGFPEPIPWRAIPELVPNPFRSPTEQPQRGPQRDPRPRQTPYPIPAPLPSPGPVPAPTPTPAPLPPPVIVQPGPGPVAPLYKPPVRPSRPPRGTKERKFRSQNASALMAVANFASEMGDLVGAIWKALPPQYRSPPKWDPYSQKWYEVGAAQKARDIYENFEHVNQKKMWDNIFDEMGEDMFYGSIGQAMRSANRKLGLRPNFLGIGTGPAL